MRHKCVQVKKGQGQNFFCDFVFAESVFAKGMQLKIDIMVGNPPW